MPVRPVCRAGQQRGCLLYTSRNCPYIETRDGLWAIRVDPTFYLTTAGLAIDTDCHVLTEDEFKQLEENILKEGKLRSPLIVWNNTLVDGHNRDAILQKHPEIYFSTMPLRFENREEAIAVSYTHLDVYKRQALRQAPIK